MSQDGPFSRHGPQRGPGWSNGNWGGNAPGRPGFAGPSDGVNGGMGPRMNGRGPSGQYHPPDQRRGICRDYYSEWEHSRHKCVYLFICADNGYCGRGAYCKYSHGEDALVPGVFPMGPPQMPGNMFMPMFPPGMPFGMGPPAAYDPHEARLDIQPAPPPGPMGRPQRSSMLPRVNGEGPPMHSHASGELPVIQDLTPPVFNDESTRRQEGPAPSPNVDTQPDGVAPPVPPVTNMEVDSPVSGPSPHSLRPPRTSQNTPTRGRGGRPGFYSGDVQRFHPERRGDKTLVVEKIPEDKLSLDSVNSWFKRFGTVTNVAVDAKSAKALVSFSTHEEAQAAWKTEDAVFGNRFVKVFWHRPMDGQGMAGQRALAASAPIVASVVAKEQTPAAPTSDAAVPVDPQSSSTGTVNSAKKAASSSSSVSVLAARQKLLEQQIAEQKVLMEKLNTAGAEEKKEIFAQLRKLGQEIKASTAQTAFTPSKKPVTSAPRPEDREAKERERLDKELEMHSAVVDGEETTEALQAKLAKLKAEVRNLKFHLSPATNIFSL
jgi:RNA-binding protein 26